MRILYLGDIYGEEVVNLISEVLPRIKQDYKINLVFANGENACGGRGITKDIYKELMKAGINALSTGNHTYSKSQIKEFIEDSNICRPANLYKALGKRYITVNYNGKKITIINLLGRVFMNMSLDCPFRIADELLNSIESDYFIIDMHAEATSEKIALANYLDGRCLAVVGTHTHVQTADERVLPKKTLYISDIGMCGPIDSVLGSETEPIIERFLTGVYTPVKTATGDLMLNGVIIDTDKNTIERFHEEYEG